MVASILERTGARLVHNRAGANMAGGIASALASASRRGGRTLTGDFGLFEVDEFWLGQVVEELEPRAMLLGNLFRDQLDRYGELETIADRWAAVVARRHGARARAQRRRPAGGRPRPPRARSPSTSASTTTRSPSPSSSTPATPSTAAAAATPTPTRPSTSPTSATTAAPTAARSGPTPTVVATDVELHGIRSAAFTLDAAARVELPLPGLYNVYNALGAAALTLSLGVALDDVVAGLQAVAPAFGRAETLDLGGRPASILLVKNPAGRERGAAHARARGRRARPARRAQRPHRRRPRRQLGLGRRLGAAGRPRAPDDVLGHARRRARAADEVRGPGHRAHPRRRRPRARARRGAAATATARSTSSPPTPRCSSCASCSPAAARRRRTGDELRGTSMWHDVECGRYDADLPLWHELAREAPEGVLDVGAGTGRVALRLAHAGHDVTALDIDPTLLAVLERARRATRLHGHDAGRRRERRSTLPAAGRAGRRADADDPAAARPRRLLRQRAPRARARRRAWRWRSPPTSRPTTAPRRCPCPTSARPTAGPTSPSRSRSGSTTNASRSSASAS